MELTTTFTTIVSCMVGLGIKRRVSARRARRLTTKLRSKNYKENHNKLQPSTFVFNVFLGLDIIIIDNCIRL